MKKFQLNKQKLNLNKLITPLLSLSLVVGCVVLFGGSVSAATTSIQMIPIKDRFPDYQVGGFDGSYDIFEPTSEQVQTAQFSTGEPRQRVYNYVMPLSEVECNYSVTSMQIRTSQGNPTGLFAGSPTTGIVVVSARTIIPQDGLYLTMPHYYPLYSLSNNSAPDNNYSEGYIGDNMIRRGDNMSLSGAGPNIDFSGAYLANVDIDQSFFGGMTIPQLSSDLSLFNVALFFSPESTDFGTIATPGGGSIDFTAPVVTIEYTDSSCPSTNTPPTITSPSAVTIPSTTTSGSTVIPGSSLAATDTDGDTLTYSVTAGNANSYFAIDSNTGNITTTQTNIPAGTYTITVQVDDSNGGTATADVTITVTTSTTPALYCPSPYGTTTLLTPSGDCDEDGITNQTEGFDPDGDGNPSTGTAPIDTDGDSIPDYLDLDSDNDGILDTEEKGTLANSSTNPSDVDSDGTPDFRDLDSDNDSTKDVLESGRNNLDTNNDGRIDGTTNTYGIPSSAASTTNPKALASTSLKDSDNNGTPDYRQSSRNAVSVLAKTGESLKTITIVAVMALGLAGYVKLKNKNSKSYRRR